MKKKEKDFENENLDDYYQNISLENKIIKKSLISMQLRMLMLIILRDMAGL